jgi:hypothetical protein
VTVKPICDPAFTLAASAVLVMLRLAHKTVSVAESEPELSLLVVKLAVLL